MGNNGTPTKVVVLYNDSKQLIKGEPQDSLAEQGVLACAQAIGEALDSLGFEVAMVPIVAEVERALAPFPPDQWLVFNLGEGLSGKLVEEARIAYALEAMGYSFTGSRGEAIARSTNKAQAKSLFSAEGLSTPPWWLFRHPSDVDDRLNTQLPFPLIVKPVAEDASLGIGEEAIVYGLEALRARVAYVLETYLQAALAEKFIPGREFNIALWGDPPEALPLAEIDFSAFAGSRAKIVSFAAKWLDGTFEYHHTPAICPAVVDQGLGEQVIAQALQAWQIIGCQGYARVDMRVDQENIPYIIEVNCNPDISPEAGFHNAARAAGYGYADMVLHILEIARNQSDVYSKTCYTKRWPYHLGDHSQEALLQSVRSGMRRRAVEHIPR
jgi:D-alanine-D-alanine ligase